MSNLSSHADRSVAQSKILLTETLRPGGAKYGLPMMLTSGAANVVQSDEKRAASSKNAPILLIKDLEQGAADHAKVPILLDPNGPPIMNDRVVEGTGEKPSESEFHLRIALTSKAHKVGSKLDQQRRPYQIKQAITALMRTWSRKLVNERIIYCAIGRRGTRHKDDQIIPVNPITLANGDIQTVDEMMTNPLVASTHNRTFFGGTTGTVNSIDGTAYPNANGGSGKAAQQITSNDGLTYDVIGRFRADLDMMVHPPEEVMMDLPRMKGGPAESDPLHIMMVDPVQWLGLQRSSPQFATWQANAQRRVSGWNHPLFRQECVLMHDILIFKHYFPVTYNQGQKVPMCLDDYDATIREEEVPNGVQLHFGFLLGGCALAQVYGKTENGQTWRTTSVLYDHKRKEEIAVHNMCGLAKVRHKGKDRYDYDRSAIVVVTGHPMPTN